MKTRINRRLGKYALACGVLLAGEIICTQCHAQTQEPPSGSPVSALRVAPNDGNPEVDAPTNKIDQANFDINANTNSIGASFLKNLGHVVSDRRDRGVLEESRRKPKVDLDKPSSPSLGRRELAFPPRRRDGGFLRHRPRSSPGALFRSEKIEPLHQHFQLRSIFPSGGRWWALCLGQDHAQRSRERSGRSCR